MKKIIQLVLLVVIVGLAYLLYSNINRPIEFEKSYDLRKAKVVERLKEIRALQEAYKGVKGEYTSSFDSLENFYNTGKMEILYSIGSMDDSATRVKTEAYVKAYEDQQKLIKARRPVKGEVLPALVELSDAEIEAKGLAVRKPLYDAVKDVLRVGNDTVLLANKPGFDIKGIRYVPGVVVDGAEKKVVFEMDAQVRETSSKVLVPLFEARVANNVFLEGLNIQEIVNLNDRISKKRVNNYQGIKVGDISNPNNNAGNWE